ncbi:MAG: DUF6513 domain-containing protein, partial [Planctomycetota bacterium]
MSSKLELSSDSHLVFVTGKLAEQAVREVVERLSSQYAFQYTIEVLPITVAALITPKWLIRKLHLPTHASHLVLPGFCDADMDALKQHFTQEVVIGPKDCKSKRGAWLISAMISMSYRVKSIGCRDLPNNSPMSRQSFGPITTSCVKCCFNASM